MENPAFLFFVFKPTKGEIQMLLVSELKSLLEKADDTHVVIFENEENNDESFSIDKTEDCGGFFRLISDREG